jgi:hypothetical protein
MVPASQFLISGLLFILTLAAGVWFSRRGRPYSIAVFNLHKLIALGAVILLARRLVPVVQALPLPSGLPALNAALLLLLGASMLLAVVLFVSGALLSANVWNQGLLALTHRTAAILLTVALASAVYWLTRPILIL